MAGAELTRAIFARAGTHLLSVSRAFADAVAAGEAAYRAPIIVTGAARGVTPAGAAELDDPTARIQVGGLGLVSAASFAGFPTRAFGQPIEAERRS